MGDSYGLGTEVVVTISTTFRVPVAAWPHLMARGDWGDIVWLGPANGLGEHLASFRHAN